MLVLKNKQMQDIEKLSFEHFVINICRVIKLEFNQFKNDKINSDEDLKKLIARSVASAGNYGITKKESIKAYCILSYLNGENFLETKLFKVYKHHLSKKLYDPNNYIFDVPNKNKGL